MGGVGADGQRLCARHPRQRRPALRFFGYRVERYKLFIFTLTRVSQDCRGGSTIRKAGIINPAEIAPHLRPIYWPLWVAIAGARRLYGAVIRAGVLCPLLSSLVHRAAVRPAIHPRFLYDPVDRLVGWCCSAYPFVCVHLVLSQGDRRLV